MSGQKQYKIHEIHNSLANEPENFMRTFSSQEEADNFRLQKSLERTDMERFQMLCRLMRIGKMLSKAKISNI